MATARPTRPSAAPATTPRRPQPARGGGGGSSASSAAARRRANTRLAYDLAGVGLVALGLILLATLAFPPTRVGENLFGRAVIDGLRLLVGEGCWAFPCVLVLSGTMLAVGKSRSWDNIGGAVTLFLLFVSWWHLAHVGHMAMANHFVRDNLVNYGGLIGAGLSWCLRAAVGTVGGHILLGALTVTAFLYLTDIPLPAVLGPLDRLLGAGARAGGQAVATGAKSAAQSASQRVADRRAAAAARAAEAPEQGRAARSGQARPRLFERGTPEPEADDEAPTAQAAAAVLDFGADEDDEPFPAAPVPADKPARPSLFPLRRTEPKDAPAVGTPDPTAAAVNAQQLAAAPAPFVQTTPKGVDPAAPSLESIKKYALPPTSLLKPPPPPAKANAGESEQRRQVLLQTLEDFGIGADIADVAYGPTFTRYEVALERGIKVSKIVSLADNLAMALAAIDVRVEAPIPGKSAIGIEVPNETGTMVTLREVIERPEFINAPSKLTFALGKDVTGAGRYADLAKMPHLLIAGSTGSGKSVGINTLISSLLYRNSPRELKFLMIDPKKVELSLYDGIPHLAAPVVTNVKQAPSIFKHAIREMENRYDKFAKIGTRNIEGFNSRVPEEEKIPYWVLIVDELADLMMTSGPEIESGICRLAQLARATGIHLVIATQRPSVNVITGTIKANISSRIAFAVNSAVDSRTILDQAGADRLVGRGDMLFMPIDAAKPQRIQGCFVSEHETEALVNYLKQQAQPNYEVLPSSLSLSDGADDSGESEPDDELFEQAVKLVVSGGGASTSMLQRRFKIGYTRAARLVDLMEQRGIVGPLDGAKPRDVLKSRDEVDQMFLRGLGGED
jgi:S-DNA-T family DNA segregation ATPase FtsK/SpoIIIE